MASLLHDDAAGHDDAGQHGPGHPPSLRRRVLTQSIERNLASLRGIDQSPRWHSRQRVEGQRRQRRPRLLFLSDTESTASEGEPSAAHTTSAATQTTFAGEIGGVNAGEGEGHREGEDEDSRGDEDAFPLGPFVIASAATAAAAAASAATAATTAAATAAADATPRPRRRSICERLRGAVTRPLRAMVQQVASEGGEQDNLGGPSPFVGPNGPRRVLTAEKESWLSGAGDEAGCESCLSLFASRPQSTHSTLFSLFTDILEIDFHTIRHPSMIEVFWSGLRRIGEPDNGATEFCPRTRPERFEIRTG